MSLKLTYKGVDFIFTEKVNLFFEKHEENKIEMIDFFFENNPIKDVDWNFDEDKTRKKFASYVLKSTYGESICLLPNIANNDLTIYVTLVSELVEFNSNFSSLTE